MFEKYLFESYKNVWESIIDYNKIMSFNECIDSILNITERNIGDRKTVIDQIQTGIVEKLRVKNGRLLSIVHILASETYRFTLMSLPEGSEQYMFYSELFYFYRGISSDTGQDDLNNKLFRYPFNEVDLSLAVNKIKSRSARQDFIKEVVEYLNENLKNSSFNSEEINKIINFCKYLTEEDNIKEIDNKKPATTIEQQLLMLYYLLWTADEKESNKLGLVKLLKFIKGESFNPDYRNTYEYRRTNSYMKDNGGDLKKVIELLKDAGYKKVAATAQKDFDSE